MRKDIYILVSLLFAVSACEKPEEFVPETPEPEAPMIRFGPAASSLEVKTLISDKTEDGYLSFEDACRDDASHVLLYSEQLNKNGNSFYDIFNEDKAVATWICYSPDEEGTYSWILDTDRVDEYGNHVKVADRPWDQGSMYEFMALYPANLEPHIYRGEKDSETESMALAYNTHSFQEDVLVAYNEVNTVDPITGKASIFVDSGGTEADVTDCRAKTSPYSGESASVFSFDNKFDIYNPVPLRFQHVMAAIRLRFHLDYYREQPDQLLETWFENISDGGFHTIGTMLFGMGSREDDLANDPGRYNQKNRFKWSTYQTSYDDSEIYKWSVKQPDGRFFSEKIMPEDITVMSRSGETKTFTTSVPLGSETMVIVTTKIGNTVTSATPTVNGTKLKTLEFLRDRVDEKWTREVDVIPVTTLNDDGTISIVSTRVNVKDATVQKLILKITENSDGSCKTEGSRRIGYGESFYYTSNNGRGNAISYADIEGVAAESKVFTKNNNTLLIIPQGSSGKVNCYFRLHSSENEAAFVTIPPFTGTKFDVESGEVTVCPTADRSIEQSNPMTQYNYYCPGYVYTYTIHIGRSTSYLNIQMQPWNELHSSADIIF